MPHFSVPKLAGEKLEEKFKIRRANDCTSFLAPYFCCCICSWLWVVAAPSQQWSWTPCWTIGGKNPTHNLCSTTWPHHINGWGLCTYHGQKWQWKAMWMPLGCGLFLPPLNSCCIPSYWLGIKKKKTFNNIFCFQTWGPSQTPAADALNWYSMVLVPKLLPPWRTDGVFLGNIDLHIYLLIRGKRKLSKFWGLLQFYWI